ncbi:unnamed protein product, partial [Callosobruchus maculatus]
MPLTDIIRRASWYILRPEEEHGKDIQYEDNEVLFCKNNVCVHPPATARQDTDILHNRGYLTITTKVFVDQYNDTKRPTLFLTWIPNASLTKHSALGNTLQLQHSIKGCSLESLNSNESMEFERPTVELKNTNPFLNYDDRDRCDMSESVSSDESDKQMISINVDISNPEIEIVQTPDSVKDPREMFEFSRSESITSTDSQLNWITTPEFLMQKHNLNFPDSASNSPILPTKRPHKCRRFSVDLSQMRSLRLFFSDNSCTCGQLVVASRESQYKILHFHHGGLDHLAQVLHQWHSLLHSIKDAKG